jgi:hypothetical protein
MIYDLTNEKDVKKYDTVRNGNPTAYGVKRSSDNLLDLVEVGDLVECLYHKESSDGTKWIETPIYYVNSISNTYFHLPVFSIEKKHKNIVAIWKRNGDTLKRYEVK